MYRWFIAYKYLFSRIIPFTALVVVASSVALLIVVVSVMEGFRSEIQGKIRGTSSDLKVEGTRYLGLKEPDKVASIVESVEGVKATAPYVETLTLFRVQGFEDDMIEDRYLRVVDLDRELRVGDLARYIEAGRAGWSFMPTDPHLLFSAEYAAIIWKKTRGDLFAPSALPPAPPPVLLGKEADLKEHLFPGTVVRLTTFSPRTQLPQTADFLVAGYFKTGLYELDSKGILLERSAARKAFGLETPDGREVASGIRVQVEAPFQNDDALVKVREKIDAALDKAGIAFVRTMVWREEKASLLKAVQVEKTLTSVILGMIVLFSGFMIFIILTVQVVEKTRDLGVMQSMGATPRGIASIYFTIGIVLCLSGTVLGTIYGVGFAMNVNTIQRWIKLLTGLEVFRADVYYLDKIPVRFQPADLVLIIVPTVLASLVASLVPAYRAARKDPVAALRYE